MHWRTLTTYQKVRLCGSVARGRAVILCSFAASITDDLKAFLELNLPKVKAGKDPKYFLGVVSLTL